MAKFVEFAGPNGEVIALDPTEVVAIYELESMFSHGRTIHLRSGATFVVEETRVQIYEAIGATDE